MTKSEFRDKIKNLVKNIYSDVTKSTEVDIDSPSAISLDNERFPVLVKFLTLNAGNAGTNNGNIDRGASGGDVTINAGDSTGNGDPGGDIILNTGLAGANALAGQVQLIVPSSDEGNGGTWTFNGSGIIQLPNT